MIRKIAGMLAVGAFTVAPALGAGFAAQATVPGTPGVPQASTLVYQEDFQNRPGPTPIVRLSNYAAADGGTYTAAAAWLSDCNGWIASSAQPVNSAAQVADCANNQSSWNRAQQLSRSLGIFRGQTAAQANNNYALSAYTSGDPGVGAVEFRTGANRPFTAGNGRFITFSADVAAVNCTVSAPLLQFQLINASGGFVNAGSQVNGCTGGTAINVPAQGPVGVSTASVKTVTSNGSVLFTGASIGLRMLNNNGSGAGNDHAVDNFRIIDASPQLDKSFSPASLVAGSNSTLTLTVTNTSELAAKNGWSFTDQLPAGLSVAGTATTTCPAGVVTAPLGGTSVAVTGNLTNGLASCTVSVDVTSPVAGTFTNGPSNISSVGLNPPADTTVEFIAPTLGIAIVKSAEPSGIANYVVGQNINYSFVVTNTGNIALQDVTVDETAFTGSGALSAVTCPAGQAASLAPQAQLTCTASYTVTQDDVDAGSITNAATATGTPTEGDVPESDPSVVTVPSEDAAPSITVVKSASPDTVAAAGETVTYSFLVTNTGNVTLSGVDVSELDFSGTGTVSEIECPAAAASLAPSAQVTCTATYVLTQADADSGSVTNSATATGTPPSGDPPVSPPSETTVEIPPTPALTIDKTADPSSAPAVGETVTYSFLVTNTGNVTLVDVAVEEEFSGTGPLSPVTCPAAAALLEPQAQVTCTATYVVTQADVDSGQLVNSATAVGTPPSGDPVPSTPDDLIIDIPEEPGLTVVKSADDAALEGIGVDQVVDYSFLVTNTGTVTLNDITVVEGDFSGSGDLSDVSCPTGPVAPQAQVTCTATYVVTQADVDAGEITNTASASGTPPSGTPVISDPSEAVVPAEVAEPSLTIVKSASPATVAAMGDEITYTFLITNTGNVTLEDVAVAEGAFSGTGQLSAINCPPAAALLFPDTSVSCTATYVVTQDDVDSGEVSNSATATGTPPGLPSIESPPGEIVVDIPLDAQLEMIKSADAAAQAEYVVGQTITYSFLVTNSSNVTVEDVVVGEVDFSGTGELTDAVCPSSAASMAPGEQVTCTATYEVTQADVDAGTITNSAIASGLTPDGNDTASPVSEAVVPSVPADPSLTVDKSASPTTVSAAGETVTYSFLVTNTGNVTITDVVIDDSDFSGTGSLSPIVCPAGAATLPPAAEVTCTATYVLTQADVDSGALTNSATATAVPPTGPSIESPPDEVVVEVPHSGALTVVKSADTAAQQSLALGQTITYSFLVTNTGNVTLTAIAIDESTFTGSGELSAIDCPPGPLAPGLQVTCTATYSVTQQDVDAGEITNVATASATPPTGDDLGSPPSEVTVPSPPAPGLSMVKSASATKATAVGQTIVYSFLATNTGNVTLSNVTIVESSFSGTGELSAITCAEGAVSLAPGEQVACAAKYSVTQADLLAASITNTASSSAATPDGGSFSSTPSSARVESPGPVLAATGFSGGGAIGVALSLLGAGALLLVIPTVRRRAD